ncbi:MAG: hypothetical protein AAFP70_11785, partial [Calditrichota bacterium]
MLRPAILLFALWAILFAPSCSKNTTTPPPPETKVDTTSHNFVWRVDTLGPLTTSLNDVAFISDTEAWAVGRIQFVDSTQTNQSHGIAKWNGLDWTFETVERAPNRSLQDISGIYSIDSNNIWLTVGSVYNWLGGPYVVTSWIRSPSSDALANKVWADEAGNVFVVGAGGLLLSYMNNAWTQYPSIGSIRLTDIFGKPDGSVIWSCGFSSNQAESKLLKFSGQMWDTVWETVQPAASPYTGLLQSIWYANNDSIIVAGSAGIYWQDLRGDSPPRQIPINLGNFPYKVRGNAAN